MPVTDEESTQLKQTGTLLGIGNAILWPLYYLDNRLGVTATVVATVAMVYAFHEEGKKENASSNRQVSFFTPPKTQSGQIEEAFNNILAGGAKVCDSITGTSPKK